MSNTEHVLGGWSAECLAFIPHTLQFLVMMALTILYSSLMENPSAFPSGRPERHSGATLWSEELGINFQIFFSHLSFVSCIQLLGHCLTCEWKMFSYHLFWNTTVKVRILTQPSVQSAPHVRGSSSFHVHNTNGSIQSTFRKLPCVPQPDYVIIPFWPVSWLKWLSEI